MPDQYGTCIVCGVPKVRRKRESQTHARRRKSCGKPACYREVAVRGRHRGWDTRGRRSLNRSCVICGKALVLGAREQQRSFRERITCSTGKQGMVSECYRAMCRLNNTKSRATRRARLEANPQFRHWGCIHYGECLTAPARANAPRWDCPKRCERREDVC